MVIPKIFFCHYRDKKLCSRQEFRQHLANMEKQKEKTRIERSLANREKEGIKLEKSESPGGPERKRTRREQGEVRNQVLAHLKDGLPPAEIRSRLDISANTFYYHVRNLRAAGHIFPEPAARRGRPPKAEDRLLAQWLAIKEQSRDRKIGRLLRVLLEEAYRRQMIGFEVYRDPLPHQSPVLQRHPQLSGYDGVAAVTAEEMRLLRALASELEKHGAGDGPENLREILAGALGEKETETLLAIARALKNFDLTNLRENARRILEGENF